jgi:hypothetical protein
MLQGSQNIKIVKGIELPTLSSLQGIKAILVNKFYQRKIRADGDDNIRMERKLIDNKKIKTERTIENKTLVSEVLLLFS